ncbi:MAG: toll/interleukin-1 receptor domain-containing protein, partial [Chloroflexi bacterium]
MERQEKPTKPVPLFLSYAYEDELLLRELEKHLHLLKQLGLITLWHRRQIVAGTDWAMVIDEHLEQAALILLLISPDYLASTYSRDEMQRALELHEQKRAWVLPILLRQVDLQGTDLSKLKPLPTNEKPIMKWSKRDEAFCDITRSLRQIIAGLSVSSHTGLLASQQSPSGSGSRDDHVKVPLVNTSWPHAEYDQTELPLPANVFCF